MPWAPQSVGPDDTPRARVLDFYLGMFPHTSAFVGGSPVGLSLPAAAHVAHVPPPRHLARGVDEWVGGRCVPRGDSSVNYPVLWLGNPRLSFVCSLSDPQVTEIIVVIALALAVQTLAS